MSSVRSSKTDTPKSTVSMNVSQYYKGKNVFVTGATGFMGKCLVEKLVRTFPDVGNVFLMMRDHPKHGTYKQRYEALLQTSRGHGETKRVTIGTFTLTKVFSRLRTENPNFADKIIPIFGDLQLTDFGMKPDELTVLYENVHVVVHAGAAAIFKEPIRRAVKDKVVALKELCDMCRNFQHLESIVHVSSLGVNMPDTDCDERLYHVDTSPVLTAYRENDDSALANYERQAKGMDDSGMYCYTKCKNLGENVLVENAAGLPVAIVRPALIHSALREPYPGWMDCAHGLSPILEKVCSGEVTSIYGNPDVQVDITPVDLCINLCLAAAWYRATCLPVNLRASDIPVFHSASAAENPILQRDLYAYARKFSLPTRASNQPFMIYTTMKDYKWNMLMKPFIRSFVENSGAAGTGEEHSLWTRALRMVEYMRLWTPMFQLNHTFRRGNTDMLEALLSPADRKLLPMDPRCIDWADYIQNYCRRLHLQSNL